MKTSKESGVPFNQINTTCYQSDLSPVFRFKNGRNYFLQLEYTLLPVCRKFATHLNPRPSSAPR